MLKQPKLPRAWSYWPPHERSDQGQARFPFRLRCVYRVRNHAPLGWFSTLGFRFTGSTCSTTPRECLWASHADVLIGFMFSQSESLSLRRDRFSNHQSMPYVVTIFGIDTHSFSCGVFDVSCKIGLVVGILRYPRDSSGREKGRVYCVCVCATCTAGIVWYLFWTSIDTFVCAFLHMGGGISPGGLPGGWGKRVNAGAIPKTPEYLYTWLSAAPVVLVSIFFTRRVWSSLCLVELCCRY